MERILRELGFVPNTRNIRYHMASCTIDGYTVWCKDFRKAQKVANRVMRFLYAMGIYAQYRVEGVDGSYQGNSW